ncbi:oligosaccharide flippase family protein [Amycolatopsis lurida]|uniref:Polysaccharide biosynthesis protein n=1 Tax=Amycolatopsis lurida NRRL 2430 TaxID=1460371 RepID=A0A2P2FIZ1_AMYLU|nr:oligosaccharide flippase family protein [Amycolatopsis lurida]KFU76690.1 polysaccharide biosynthesis protein [Amycolatopsis lurida NRRL 2430]
MVRVELRGGAAVRVAPRPADRGRWRRMTGELGTKAARGSLWLGAVNLVSKGSQMVVTLALAALLTEGELGVVALAVSLVNLGQVVQSIGVYDVISRTERDSRRMAGTVLTLSVGAGLFLGLVLVAVASPVTEALGVPDAAGPVRLAALGLPFAAAGGVQLALLHRELDFRRRMVPDGGSAVLGAAVTIVFALDGAGPMSLVAGFVCASVAQPLLGALMGGGIRPCWDSRAAVEALRWVAIVGPAAVVAALLVNLDYLAVGRLLGPEAVGVYSLAYRLAWVPYITVAIVLGAVAFPVFTRLCRRDGPLREMVSRFTRAVLVLTGGLYLALAVLADRVVLLGARWADAATPLVLLCGYGLGICLLQIWYQAVKATGHARRYLALECSHLGLLVAGLALLTPFGIEVVAAVQFAAAWLMLPIAWHVLARLEAAPPVQELTGIVSRVLAACVLGALPAVLLDQAGSFGSADSVPGALGEGLVLMAGYTAATLAFHRRELLALRRGGLR